jgi:polyhydroxyalkanoate synthesis regulator phasin
MELAEYLGVLGGIAALLGLQGFWINRSLNRVEQALDVFKAQNHADMATHTSHIADLRERVAKIEG